MQLTIRCAGTPANVVNETKCLGIIFDSKLEFLEQTSIAESKVARAISILSRLKVYFPKIVLIQLYFLLVHPSLLYENMVWGSTYLNYLLKLQILQNKSVRIITGAHFRETVNPIYAKLNILKVDDQYNLDIAKFVFN